MQVILKDCFWGPEKVSGNDQSNEQILTQLIWISQPLRELLSPKVSWIWEQAQQEAFEKVKAEIPTLRVLSHYSIDADTKISADASSHGLEAVLVQLHNGEWKSLSDTECRYAQIEKEALALTWACEKFSEYVLGEEIELETDHKPLVLLLGRKVLTHYRHVYFDFV